MPNGLEPKDEHYALAVLILQNKYFGSFPADFFQLLDDEGKVVLSYVQDHCGDETESFLKAPLNSDDKDFILYLVKPDPRDRPSAIDALTYPWFDRV